VTNIESYKKNKKELKQSNEDKKELIKHIKKLQELIKFLKDLKELFKETNNSGGVVIKTDDLKKLNVALKKFRIGSNVITEYNDVLEQIVSKNKLITDLNRLKQNWQETSEGIKYVKNVQQRLLNQLECIIGGCILNNLQKYNLLAPEKLHFECEVYEFEDKVNDFLRKPGFFKKIFSSLTRGWRDKKGEAGIALYKKSNYILKRFDEKRDGIKSKMLEKTREIEVINDLIKNKLQIVIDYLENRLWPEDEKLENLKKEIAERENKLKDIISTVDNYHKEFPDERTVEKTFEDIINLDYLDIKKYYKSLFRYQYADNKKYKRVLEDWISEITSNDESYKEKLNILKMPM